MAAVAPRHITVSRDGRVFQCIKVKQGWQCGACGVHVFGFRPAVGGECECGAKIEEVL